MDNKQEMTARELVDLMFPKHDRSSCSDKHPENGINSIDEHIRCSRCALLSLIDNPKLIKHVKKDSSYISIMLK